MRIAFHKEVRQLWLISVVVMTPLVLLRAAHAELCLDDATSYITTDATSNDAPFTVNTCDIDGDGDMDIITANDASDTVSILLNMGNGMFSTAVRWPVGEFEDEIIEPVDVDCCDIDGDNRLDIITANHTSDDISVLFNEGSINGVPQFSMPVRYAVGEAPWAVRCLPINMDQHADIVVANFTSDSVSVLLNMGDGTFDPTRSYDVSVGDGPRSLATCDVDGDNDSDIITGNFTSKNVTVLRNDGIDGLVNVGDFAVSVNPFDIACCDMDNADGVDVVTANFLDNSVTILFNQGDGTFGNPAHYTGADGAFGVTCGDINGRNGADVITANLTSDNLSIFLNSGDGTLLEPSFYPVGTHPSSVILSDLNIDNDSDIIVSFSDGIMVFLNNCPSVGDFDGDGDTDMADFGTFQVCFGQDPLSNECEGADLDSSGYVDLMDFQNLQNSLTAPHK